MQGLKIALRLWLAVLRDAVSLYWLVPAIPLIAVIPEFLQHVWEVRAGMFDSFAAAKALAMDPERWQWGYLKIAGLVLCIFAAARYWAARKAGIAWWSLRGIAWKALGIALLFNAAATLLPMLLKGQLGQTAEQAATVLFTLATLPLLPLVIAPLLGIDDFTIGKAYRSGWWIALRSVLLIAVWWAALQWLHGWNHRLAMGAPDAAVWALMVWDSLVVGVMAAVAGTGLHHGFTGKAASAP